MSRVFAIPRSDDRASLDWFVRDLDAEVEQLSSEQVKKLALTDGILVVPGQDVFSASVSVSARNKSDLRAACMFHLEDELAEPVSDAHFAIGEKDADSGERMVQVLSESAMGVYFEALENSAGGRSDTIKFITDTNLLSQAAEPVIYDGDGVVLLYDGDNAYAIDGVMAAELVPAILQESDAEIFDYVTGSAPVLNLQRLSIEARPAGMSSYPSFIARYLDARDALDLRQGKYQAKSQLDFGGLKKWRLSLVMSGIAAVIGIAYVGVSAMRLNTAADEMYHDSITLYQTVFPDETRVTNPANEVRKKLSSTTISEAGPSNVMGLLSVFYASVSNIEGVEVNSVSYNSGADRLSSSLKFTSYEEREAFKQDIERKQLTIELGGVSQQNGILIGNAVIGRAS